ncbi:MULTISPECIES: tyrosine-type recombinase/integrase [Pseudonocardia]|nr:MULTISPECIES: tyrosine-type recombinase/integrase [Pseudonocardia]
MGPELTPRSILRRGCCGGNFRRNVFDDAAARVGIVGLSPHGLRHTAASMAIAAGATVVVVQTVLGHSSPVVTLRTYSHLFADDLDTVADRLQEAKIKADADQVRTDRPVSDLPMVKQEARHAG